MGGVILLETADVLSDDLFNRLEPLTPELQQLLEETGDCALTFIFTLSKEVYVLRFPKKEELNEVFRLVGEGKALALL